MNTTAKVIQVGRGVSRTVMGEVEEQTWTTIAAEVDDVVQPDQVGKRQTTRRVHFAYEAEAKLWVAEHEAEGWTRSSERPVPCATFYFGPTDSDSNCWSVEVYKDLD